LKQSISDRIKMLSSKRFLRFGFFGAVIILVRTFGLRLNRRQIRKRILDEELVRRQRSFAEWMNAKNKIVKITLDLVKKI